MEDSGGLFSGVGLIFYLVWLVVLIVAGWKMYVKGGQHGWTVIIPIINVLALLKIVHKPWWWILLLLIPFVGLVFLIIILYDLSKAFGHGWPMALLLIFLTPIGFLVLGYGGSQYQLEEDRLFG